MNNHTVHGRLTKDPQFTPRPNSETSDRVNFTVAVDARYGDESYFFDCVCFGKRAEVIDKYFRKGQEIIVTGEGQIHSYTDREGVKRRSYSIFVTDFDFCGSRRDKPSDSWEQLDEDNPFIP